MGPRAKPEPQARKSLFLDDGPAEARVAILLAHGAGAGMDSPFMDAAAKRRRAGCACSVRFPPRGACRENARRPDADFARAFRATAGEAGARLILAGKSMAGASPAWSPTRSAPTAFCFGFPSPARTPRDQPAAHLARLKTPALIVQGERDPFGGRAETARLSLSPAVRFHWVADGDHDLKPRKSSGLDADDLFEKALDAAAAFARS